MPLDNQELIELKGLIEKDGKLTAELQKKFEDFSKADAVRQDEIKKLSDAVAANAKDRAAMEVKYNAEIAEAKKLAEEASLKAGRRKGAGGDDGPDEVQVEHKNAFLNFIRHPHDPEAVAALRAAEAKQVVQIEGKAVSTATQGAGGAAVPTLLATEINRKLPNLGVMRGLVRTITIGTPQYSELVDKLGAGYGWVGEGAARTETTTPGVYRVTPTFGTIYAYPKATEESLNDMYFDVEAWLQSSVEEQFPLGEDVAVISGNGVNKPTGMLNTAPLAANDGSRTDGVYQYVATGAAGAFGADPHKNLIDLIYRMKSRYRPNGSWLMNSLTTAAVRVIKDAENRPMWQDNMQAGEPPTLLGYKVGVCESMPDIAANSHPIGFGDLKRAYVLVDLVGLRMTKDEITEPGFVKWHIRKRLGGCVTNDDAFKFLKIAAA